MTAKTDLPSMPERFDCTNGSAQWCYGCYTMTRDDLGDYVLAEDYDALRNASEALQAEIEALRAEVAEAREFRDKLTNAIGNDQLRRFIEKHGEPVPLTIRMQEAEARAERLEAEVERVTCELMDAITRADKLEEALRELVDVFSESGMYDEEVFAKARAALGQENSND